MHIEVETKDNRRATGLLRLNSRSPIQTGSTLKVYNERPADNETGKTLYFTVIPSGQIGNAVVTEGEFTKGDRLVVRRTRA